MTYLIWLVILVWWAVLGWYFLKAIVDTIRRKPFPVDPDIAGTGRADSDMLVK